MRWGGRHRATRFWFLAGMLIGLAGCGSADRTYPVHGKLVYEDGSPAGELEGFDVMFSSPEIGKASRGSIQQDGTFTLSTNQPDDGACPGRYKVTLTQPHPEPGRPERRHAIVDLAYEDPEHTPLESVVEPKNNAPSFTLKKLQQRKH